MIHVDDLTTFFAPLFFLSGQKMDDEQLHLGPQDLDSADTVGTEGTMS
jgi:hypothetical protein